MMQQGGEMIGGANSGTDQMVKLLWLALILLVSTAYSAAEPERCCVPITMDVALRTANNGQPALAIKLTNTGVKPVRFSIGSGPWIGAHQIQLVAIKLPLGLAVPNDFRSMRDPALGYVTIDPGQSEEEEIPLGHLYSELAAELRGTPGEYVLFWTYQLHAESGVSERMGGWLIVEGESKP